jgi:hypothetical protein
VTPREQLDPGPLVAAIGGALLIVSLFLDWYEPAISSGPPSRRSTSPWRGSALPRSACWRPAQPTRARRLPEHTDRPRSLPNRRVGRPDRRLAGPQPSARRRRSRRRSRPVPRPRRSATNARRRGARFRTPVDRGERQGAATSPPPPAPGPPKPVSPHERPPGPGPGHPRRAGPDVPPSSGDPRARRAGCRRRAVAASAPGRSRLALSVVVLGGAGDGSEDWAGFLFELARLPPASIVPGAA